MLPLEAPGTVLPAWPSFQGQHALAVLGFQTPTPNSASLVNVALFGLSLLSSVNKDISHLGFGATLLLCDLI